MVIKVIEPEELARFLKDKPAQWSHLVAARAALRVLPVALSGMSERDWLLWLRANFTSLASAKFPTLDTAAALRSVRDFDASDESAAGSALLSCYYALLAYSAADSARLSALSAALSVVRSSRANAASAVWRAISGDLSWLTERDASQATESLAFASLWRGDAPLWALGRWRSFTANNEASARGYAPWIAWYQALLTGDGTNADYFGTDLTIRIATQPDKWWDRPAREVNADIAAWLAERDNQNSNLINKMDEVQKQLVQRPAAASFGWTGDQLAVNALAPLPPASLAQDFLDEVRVKALDLRDRLAMTNAAPRVRNSLNGVIAVLPGQATDLRPGLLRSRARSLHADATAYAGQFQHGELPVDATAMLLDLSGGLRDLEGCFPELRDIEKEIVALNLKPTDVAAVQKHLVEINDVVAASDMVADSAKRVMAVGAETMKAEAAPEIVEVRTAEQALTTRNLANAALKGNLQQILLRLRGTTGRVYDETEKAGLNVIRPVVSVGTALTAGAGATMLFGGIFGPVFALATLGLAEFDRLPGVINFIKEALKLADPGNGNEQ